MQRESTWRLVGDTLCCTSASACMGPMWVTNGLGGMPQIGTANSRCCIGVTGYHPSCARGGGTPRGEDGLPCLLAPSHHPTPCSQVRCLRVSEPNVCGQLVWPGTLCRTAMEPHSQTSPFVFSFRPKSQSSSINSLHSRE